MAETFGIVKVSIEPFEVVFRDREISIATSAPMDRIAARGGLRLEGQRATVTLKSGGRRALLQPVAKLAPGPHRLVIEGLHAASGGPKLRPMVVPFLLVDSKARIPAQVRLEACTRLRVGALSTERLAIADKPRGRYVEVFKATRRQTGQPLKLAFDQTGARVDFEAMLRKMAKRRWQRFGKLHEHLYERLRTCKATAKLRIAVWLKVPPLELDKPATGSSEHVMSLPREHVAAIAQARERFVRTAGVDLRFTPDGVAPVVYADVPARQVRALAAHPDVAGVFLVNPRGIPDLTNSISIANSDDVHTAGFEGSGVRVAVFELGPDVTTDLVIAGTYDTSSSASTSDHARLTHGVIRNNQSKKPHGHAPACSLYSANSYDLQALAWAVQTPQCTVISQSFHRDEEQTSATLSYDDIYKDWLVLHPPYPTIIQAAGNGDANEYVNHKGYNSLSAGNHNDTATALAADSVGRNPSTTHGDRQLPEISANGTGVTAVGLTMSGTSFASPAVAGVVACLQGQQSILKSWPEGCRALLLAGAHKITNKTWWDEVSSKIDTGDGAGACDAQESMEIARHRSGRNAAGTSRGWDIGTLTSSDFGSDGRATFRYRIHVAAATAKVRVALAWDSQVNVVSVYGLEFPVSSALDVDFDLLVRNAAGVGVASSSSWDNTYEIAAFDAVAGDYEIIIRRYSGTRNVWYGIAWTAGS
jgi:hypothetical protein